MQTAVLRKGDLMQMLLEMESQLEQLDHSIVFNISQQHQRWEIEQETRLDSYVKQMEILEGKMTANRERQEINSKSFRLKLSY
ncbi:hypothetical protein R4Z10_14750 [Niallia sp. XMNu-256]|uniref:hypothetical protein n=1 Tax=Niallia sp. XMNu-256 TaxID=3082444 RepID=UPI0030D3D54E